MTKLTLFKGKFSKKKYAILLRAFLGLTLTAFLLFLSYNLSFRNKIFPNTFIAGQEVSGLNLESAAETLSSKTSVPEKINLVSSSDTFMLNAEDIGLSYDYQKSAQRAFNLTRTGNYFFDMYLRTKLLFKSQDMGLVINFDEESLDKFIQTIASQIISEPRNPSAKFVKKELTIDEGEKGTVLDQEYLKALIGQELSYAKSDDIKIPLQTVDPTLTSEELSAFKQRAEKYRGKKIYAKFEFETFTFDENDILSFLNPKGGFNEESIKDEIFKIAQDINRDPQEPKFDFENGKVQEFLPAKDGIETNIDGFLEETEKQIEVLADSEDKSASFDIPVDKTPSKISTEGVNDKGIKELIGRGTSTFYHSISGRIFNISLASSRINGTLVAPGETFSFNKTLGDVTKETGFKEAYIIQSGRTVLGDGGGVCQVSTTLFRAVLDAGLPITERRAHAYRVGYYEQDSPPGIDATVFYPTTDFKFTNDTDNYILISAKANPKTYSLVFELYGTSDGRVASISKPVVTKVTSAPEDIYQDDPTLPLGTIKQVDYKANGAKVTFNYLVKKEGETVYNKTFVSNYQPWAAIYLRGTAPVN